jgi:hypothetical protein
VIARKAPCRGGKLLTETMFPARGLVIVMTDVGDTALLRPPAFGVEL